MCLCCILFLNFNLYQAGPLDEAAKAWDGIRDKSKARSDRLKSDLSNAVEKVTGKYKGNEDILYAAKHLLEGTTEELNTLNEALVNKFDDIRIKGKPAAENSLGEMEVIADNVLKSAKECHSEIGTKVAESLDHWKQSVHNCVGRALSGGQDILSNLALRLEGIQTSFFGNFDIETLSQHPDGEVN